jgi:trigger factor
VKSAVETLNPTRVKLTVEVPFEELKPSLDAAYKSIAQQANVPGFRKGHVPPRIIDQRFGRGVVLEEAVNDALPTFYTQAVKDASLRPLGRPEIAVTDVPDPAAGSELKFTVEVDVAPEVTLPDLEGYEVIVDDVEVTSDDVDKQLTALRERFGTLVGVDRAAADADFLTVDVRAEIDGEEIDSVKGVSYQVGSGTMLEGMDDAVTGLSVGESKTFASPLAGGDHAGQDAEVTVTVQAVKERQLPEADDDFAQLASEFDTLEELQGALSEQLGTLKRMEQSVHARDHLIGHLMEQTEVPVPEALILAEVTQHLENEGREADDDHRAEVEKEAREAFQRQMVLDAVAESQKVSVTQKELAEYLVATAQQYDMEPGEFMQAVSQSGQISSMVSDVARRKALITLLQQVTVKDTSGNVLDMSVLLPQEDEQAEAPTTTPAEGAPVPAAADPTALPISEFAEFEPADAPVGTSQS